MTPISYTLRNKGLLNTPGITYASKKATEALLIKDAQDHHCFFRQSGFHNHLSHHILAAYDLGASPGLLHKIYMDEARTQRPRILERADKDLHVTRGNWSQYLGNQAQVFTTFSRGSCVDNHRNSAYSSFVSFFADEIHDLGASATLEKYVFDEDANKVGSHMLTRVMSGAVHPFIQIGYGTEFGDDVLIATENRTFLELLRQVYDSEVLKPPMPYDPNALINARLKSAVADGRKEEIEKISAQFNLRNDFTDDDVAQKAQEIIWTATLLTFATGKPGRKPRLDFFLMHLLTSSLFLRPFCAMLKNKGSKAALLRAYVPIMITIILSRGRPRINPELMMSYTDVPRPPLPKEKSPTPSGASIGSPLDDTDYNPWPALIEAVRYHPDSHVLKAMRTLIYGSQHFGTTPAAEVIGAYSSKDQYGAETHKGMSAVDGTIFVRAAGVLMDTLGWVNYGQAESEWDRSALGWEAAWETGSSEKN
ncbi:hypothetical protein CPB84DRAFT_1851350 [Gymnopilus junonius]|uniref:Oxidoreductase AflY n=1 Tax=Gymnopilus junonius TaxID=109634 RepID=A0A9P5NEP1_GYMJU|nr:hypothetical protein CPB84DRAFT_1851350 [Gymnopilus junonius]